MQAELLNDLLPLAEQCLKWRQGLVRGKFKLSIRSNLVHFLNEIIKGDPRNPILTVSQRKLIEDFNHLCGLVVRASVYQRSVESFEQLIDLSCFSSLKTLELCHVPLRRVKGLGKLKCQLKTLICTHCVQPEAICLESKLHWAELVSLHLKHSAIPKDQSEFFRPMPWIQILDLSFCQLDDCEFLLYFDHLLHLHLSFNCLKSLPILNKKSRQQLQVLNISHNALTSLIGLENYTSLTRLDVSWNQIISKSELSPLTQLKSLQWIDMSNNPISFVEFYRAYLTSAIGSQIDPDKFTLDRSPLSKVEAQVFGRGVVFAPEEHPLSIPQPRPEPFNSGESMSKNLGQVRRVVIHDPDASDEPESHQPVIEPEEPRIASTPVPTMDPNPSQECATTLVVVHVSSANEPDETNELSESEKLDSILSADLDESTETHETSGSVSGDHTRVESESAFESCVSFFEEEHVLTEAKAKSEVVEDLVLSGKESLEDLLWWPVTKNDSTGESQVFLCLLESELKERCTFSGQTISKWDLSSVLSCTKTSTDPITVVVEFDVEEDDRRYRSYQMEFADAQTLVKKLYAVLDAKPSSTNQSLAQCHKCSSTFAQLNDSDSETIVCPDCNASSQDLEDNTAEISQTNVPKLNELDDTSNGYAISESPSQSSIALVSSVAPSSSIESCSAASLEHSQKNETSQSVFSPRKYESDVEIISNPSQSSIEILDEHRPQPMVPGRKRSSEERQTVAVPLLGTVLEVTSPFSALTESSSSGSLTESVITAYEGHNATNKKHLHNECLLEESENFAENVPQETKGTVEEENVNTSHHQNPLIEEIYSYTNFLYVDERILNFLRDELFTKSEELLVFTRCQVWKTGGTDYDGCFVLTTSSVYFLFHSYTDFSGDACDWLSKNESYKSSDLKKFCPLIYNQGVGVQMNEINYLLLFMDQQRTCNFLDHLKELNLKWLKITGVNTKIETNLQSAVTSCHHSTFDPTVNYVALFRSVTVSKDECKLNSSVCEETTRLACLVITSGEFYITEGNLNWLCTSEPPTISCSQSLSSLIEVERKPSVVALHFFDESEAVEEVWSLKCTSLYQAKQIIQYVRTSWEKQFLVSLEVTGKF